MEVGIPIEICAQPTSCALITNTGSNHSIVMAYLSPMLNGAPLPVGSYIIVQYEREGDLVCGGFTQWNGSDTYLTAFGDDQTTMEKDGFTDGEDFRFLLELPDGTVIGNQDIHTEYLSGGIYSHAGQYANNGISGLATFVAATGLLVNPVVWLQGPYETATGLMRDVLRTDSAMPLDEPYAALGYTHVGSGVESVQPGVFEVAGQNAIVDWLFLELRDKNNEQTILATRSALLQADGDVVDVDGVSPVAFPNLSPDDYYLVIKHRNHLGVMTAAPVTLSGTPTVVDFTTDLNQMAGGANGIAMLPDGKLGLFSGDFNRNGQVQNTDYAAMVLTLGTAGYLPGDFDLNGQVQNTDLQLKLVPNIGRGAAFQ